MSRIPLTAAQQELAKTLGIEGASHENAKWVKPTQETINQPLRWSSQTVIEVVGYFVHWLHQELYITCYTHEPTSWGGRNAGADIIQDYPARLFEPSKPPTFRTPS